MHILSSKLLARSWLIRTHWIKKAVSDWQSLIYWPYCLLNPPSYRADRHLVHHMQRQAGICKINCIYHSWLYSLQNLPMQCIPHESGSSHHKTWWKKCLQCELWLRNHSISGQCSQETRPHLRWPAVKVLMGKTCLIKRMCYRVS